MAQIKILAFCGSLRKSSFNKMLLLQACDELRGLQCDVTFLDLKALAMPVYDGDLEDELGMPSGAEKLVGEINASQAVLIASPEYNGSIPGGLKNAIDWATRAEKNPFSKKVCMIMGTSIGHWGASKSMINLRHVLGHLQGIVIPSQLTVPFAAKAFDANGVLIDPNNKKMLKGACEELVTFAKALGKINEL